MQRPSFVILLSVLPSAWPPTSSGRIERRQLCRNIHLCYPAGNRIVPDAPRQTHICPRHSQLSVTAHAIAWVLLFFLLFSPDCPFISLRFCRIALSTPCQQSEWPKSRLLSTFVCFHVGSSSKSAMSKVIMAGVNLHWRVIHSQSKAVSIR